MPYAGFYVLAYFICTFVTEMVYYFRILGFKIFFDVSCTVDVLINFSYRENC